MKESKENKIDNNSNLPEKILIFTHNDLDGFFSAALAILYYKYYIKYDAEFDIKVWTYGNQLPEIENVTKKYKKVFILDISLNKDYFLSLYEFYRHKYDYFQDDIIFIDHHKTPDKELISIIKEKYNTNINGLLNYNNAACENVYLYFFQDRQDIPEWLKLLSEFDCWNKYDENRWENKVLPYQYYMKSIINSPQDAINYLNTHFDNISCYNNKDLDIQIENGLLLLNQQKNIYKHELSQGYILKNIADLSSNSFLTAYIINTQSRSSLLFEGLKKSELNKIDIFIAYHFNGKLFRFSCYTLSDKIDCSKLKLIYNNKNLKFFDELDCTLKNNGYIDVNSNISPEDNIILEFHGHQKASGATAKYNPFLPL